MAVKDVNIIIKKVAEELDMPTYEVVKIVSSIFGYVFDLVEGGTFEGFYMRGFGKFIVKPRRLEHLKKMEKEKRERELNGFEDPLDLS